MVTKSEFVTLIVICLIITFTLFIVAVGANDVTTSIFISICGDGLVQPNETCDAGSGNNTGAYASSSAARVCASDCFGYGPHCGDSTLQVRFLEECDDGNNTSGDLCSATCEAETAVPPTGSVTGRPDVGGIPSGNGTPGEIPSVTETKVVLRGKASPGSNITILLDGKRFGSVLADSNADFFYSATNVTPGTATFGFLARDQDGVDSIVFSTVFEVIQSAVTTVANIFIPPTIRASSDQVAPGDLITLSGKSVPLARSVTQLYPATSTVISDIDETGDWALQLDTGSLSLGYHTAKSYFELADTVKSGFGRSVSFYVGSGEPPGQASSDLNGDDRVNLVDFSIFLTDWGSDAPRSDFNGDGKVNLADFSILLFNWTG